MRLTGRIGKLAAAALVISMVTAGVASAAQTQSVSVGVSPRKLSASKMAPVALKIHTATSDPAAANGIPSPAVRAVLDFDNDVAVNPALKGLGKCDPTAIAGLPTAQARATCPRAIVGGGAAKVRIPWPVPAGYIELPLTVTAFNATNEPVTGRPRIILYAWQQDTAQGSSIVGVLKRSTAGADYSRQFDLDIPLLLGGTGALTDFTVTIGNGYKKGYVKARCHDSNRRLNLKTRFYYNNATSLPASASALCARR